MTIGRRSVKIKITLRTSPRKDQVRKMAAGIVLGVYNCMIVASECTFIVLNYSTLSFSSKSKGYEINYGKHIQALKSIVLSLLFFRKFSEGTN